MATKALPKTIMVHLREFKNDDPRLVVDDDTNSMANGQIVLTMCSIIGTYQLVKTERVEKVVLLRPVKKGK